MRIKAVETLTNLPSAMSTDSREALIQALKTDPNPAVRIKAVEALANLAEEGRPGRRGHARHAAREGVAGRREHVRPRQGGGGAEQRSTVMRQTLFLAAAVLFLALPLSAANKVYVDGPITKTYPLDIAGTFWIDNPEGTIEITGVEGARTTITAVTTIIAVDGDGPRRGRENTKLSFDCDNPHRAT